MKFSISVPVGAYHPFLKYCLRSLAVQKGIDLEIALLDASGDDRVRALADEFSNLLAYTRHGPDNGQSDAILEGWRNTNGDVLGWLNADDALFPDALARVAKALNAEAKPDVVCGQSTIVDEFDNFKGYQWGVEPPGDRLLEAAIISQPSCFFRRSSYDDAGGLNADLHYTMDWDLFIRLYLTGAKFVFVDEPLSKIMWGEDTKTASFKGRRKEELSTLVKTYAPPETQSGIMKSFQIQNILENIRPEFLQTLATRLMVRGRQIVYGLAADGQVHSPAKLVLLHYDKTGKAGVRLRFRNAEAVKSVQIVGADHEWLRMPDGFLLTPKENLLGATPVLVMIETKAEGLCWFVSCEWLDKAD